MDSLLEGFSKCLEVDSVENVLNHRQADYKKKSGKLDDQNVRRKKRLEELKQRRFDAVSHLRKLPKPEASKNKNKDETKDDSGDSKMDLEPQKEYETQLMLSEWLVDMPDDFEENWLMQVCPIGRRNLVVVDSLRVSVYTKIGKLAANFKIGILSNECANKTSVLDCIFSVTEGVYYVLDTMAWNDHYFYDSDTDFRFYFTNQKILEIPKIDVRSAANPYPFKPLTPCKCSKEAILKELEKWDMDKVDGMLFYHKKTKYTFGYTPLVTWITPNMLDKVLEKLS